MKKYTKPALLAALVIFIIGVLFALSAIATGGNYFRAMANIDRLMSENAAIKFEFATPEPTAIPYTDPFEEFFGGSDMFDIFEQFGMGDDFMMPYGGYNQPNPGISGKIY